ncbi:MAG TPA: GNAT family N-acetyltransferase [Trebonia sp.]|nr:GNAT family N-acetyltransferase [Trebonia sp.]
MPADMHIHSERSADTAAVSQLHTAAFADDGLVSRLVDALKAAPAALAPLSFVATVGGTVAGHVLLTASRLDAPARLVDVYVLSPLGVLPRFQRRGVGTALIRHALAAAAAKGLAPLVFLEGDPAYYGGRGFERADARGFRAPSLRIPPLAFQVATMPSYEPWMTGTLVYSDPFWAHDCVGLRSPLLLRVPRCPHPPHLLRAGPTLHTLLISHSNLICRLGLEHLPPRTPAASASNTTPSS